MNLKDYTESLVKKYSIILKPDQNFMIDEKLIKKIVSCAKIKPDETILEIGAGLGFLTKEIARSGSVIAVELDSSLETILKKEIENSKMKIVTGNILDLINNLEFDKIVSNIPYSICESLLQKLTKIKFDLAVLTVPKSFAYRLIKENTKLYYFSRAFFSAKILFDVPKEAFYPKPNTSSTVIELKPKTKKEYRKEKIDYILRELFLQGEKKLKNSLREAIINLNKEILGKNLTKRKSKGLIEELKIADKILEKRPIELDFADMKYLKEKLEIIL